MKIYSWLIAACFVVVSNSFAGAVQTVQECLTQAGPNGVCTLPSAFSETVTSTIGFQAGQTLNCSNGTMTLGSAISLMNINVPSVTIEGCTLDGNSFKAHSMITASSTGLTIKGSTIQNSGTNGLALEGASDIQIEHNRFINNAGFGIYLTGASDTQIVGNSFNGMGADSIYGENNTKHVVIGSNKFQDGKSTAWHHVIAFHSTTANESVLGITITGNYITANAAFCVEVGAFGGSSPSGIVVSGNNCFHVLNMAPFGGYSFDTVAGLVFSGNSFINETDVISGLPGIELVHGTSATASGNRLSRANITIDKQNLTVVSSNNLKDGKIAIMATGGTNLNNNSVTDNVIDNSSGMVTQAIWLQCNTVSANCSGNRISGNQLIGANLAGSRPALTIENDASSTAVLDGTSVTNNVFTNWPATSCYRNMGTHTITANNVGCAKITP